MKQNYKFPNKNRKEILKYIGTIVSIPTRWYRENETVHTDTPVNMSVRDQAH